MPNIPSQARADLRKVRTLAEAEAFRIKWLGTRGELRLAGVNSDDGALYRAYRKVSDEWDKKRGRLK